MWSSQYFIPLCVDYQSSWLGTTSVRVTSAVLMMVAAWEKKDTDTLLRETLVVHIAREERSWADTVIIQEDAWIVTDTDLSILRTISQFKTCDLAIVIKSLILQRVVNMLIWKSRGKEWALSSRWEHWDPGCTDVQWEIANSVAGGVDNVQF